MKVSCAADSFQKQRPWTSSRAGATRCPHNREKLYHFLLELFFPLRFDFLLVYWAANGPLWEWKTPIPSGSVLPPAAPSFPGETGFLCGVRTVVGFHLWSGLLLGRWPWGTWASCGRWEFSDWKQTLFVSSSFTAKQVHLHVPTRPRSLSSSILRIWVLLSVLFLVCIIFVLEMSTCLLSWVEAFQCFSVLRKKR